jgi:hypothetical protein
MFQRKYVSRFFSSCGIMYSTLIKDLQRFQTPNEPNFLTRQPALRLVRIGLRKEIIMRGAFIIGLLIVALIVGVLVIKNMGTDNSGGITENKAKNYIEKAETTAGDVNKRLTDFKKQAKGAEAD